VLWSKGGELASLSDVLVNLDWVKCQQNSSRTLQTYSISPSPQPTSSFSLFHNDLSNLLAPIAPWILPIYALYWAQLARSLCRLTPSKTEIHLPIHSKSSISTLCTYSLSLQTALQCKTGMISSLLLISIPTFSLTPEQKESLQLLYRC
jgi:hypothetical protein